MDRLSSTPLWHNNIREQAKLCPPLPTRIPGEMLDESLAFQECPDIERQADIDLLIRVAEGLRKLPEDEPQNPVPPAETETVPNGSSVIVSRDFEQVLADLDALTSQLRNYLSASDFSRRRAS